MTQKPLQLGFISLGIMGTPMCLNLIRGGHQLFVHTRSKVPAALADTPATQCLSARGVAERADIIFTMLPDTPDVEQVLFGDDGLALGLSPGKLVIDMSSIAPLPTQDFARRIEMLGCQYLDAPVSGGEVGAQKGTLSIMVGGPEAAFARARPLFELLGQNITLVGPNGAGQTTKVANQIVVALNIEAVAEALLFASRAGADPAKVRQALMGGFAASRILEVHGERMIRRSFEPGFRIALHQKDLALPATAQAQQLFSACVAQGGAAWDHSGMVKALERLSNFEVGQKAA